jgi:pimeloyl-ACP methyl ester carboxylesterase
MMLRCACWPAVLLAALVPICAAFQEKSPSLEQAGKTFIELLDKGEFATATKAFDATMLKVMPPDELKKTWEKVVAQSGAFQKQLGCRIEMKEKHDIIHITCEFARTKLDARVVFDKDAKIAGLFFVPTPKPAPTGTEEIYEGKLKAGVVGLNLVFHLFKQKDGTYAGTLDSPDQGVKGLVFDEVNIKDAAVRLELKSLKIVFEGKRSKDGQEIAGTFKQLGQALPLMLQRVANVKEVHRPQLPKKPYPYDELDVAYENKKAGVTLAGTLTVPRSPGPFPGVLLITGSGPQDRDETILGHKPFLVLADHLTRRGIAVLRVDDRGVGASTGKFQEATTVDFADDVRAGIDFLKSRKEIDSAHIGLIGHSEGGIIAPMVASHSHDVAFIVMLAGTGVPGHEIVLTQNTAMLKLAAIDAEALAHQRAMLEQMIAVIRGESDNAVAEKKIHAVIDETTAKLGKEQRQKMKEAMPQIEKQVQQLMSPWFRFFLDYDPRPALRRVRCPVLALNGAKDAQVNAKTNLRAIEMALKQGGNKDFTIRELPNLNHLFQTCKTGAISEYREIEETFASVALDAIAEWILNRRAQLPSLR